MSTSLIVLTAILISLMLGFGDRFLDKMRMSDRTAFFVLLLIIAGIIVPPIYVTKWFCFSFGGFIVPLGVCVYLLVKVGWSKDMVRAIVGTFVTAGVIICVQYLIPAEPEKMWIDPMFVYGLIAGVVAYILGRSRKNAFICAVLGVTFAKLGVWSVNWLSGIKEVLGLGVGGAFDTLFLSVLFAVGFAEFFGETMEKLFPRKKNKNVI